MGAAAKEERALEAFSVAGRLAGQYVNPLVLYTTVTGGPKTGEYAQRFNRTWHEHVPNHRSETLVICNGGPAKKEDLEHFWWTGLWVRKNEGGDIGGYLDVARNYGLIDRYDALICFGETVYFHRERWMQRIAEVWDKFGPGLYGMFASNLVRPHLNTTAFVVCPKLLAAWPETVVTREQRYAFEHGPHSICNRIAGLAKPVKLVTFDHVLDMGQWRATQNALWQGDQSDCLVKCIHTERFDQADQKTRDRWRRNADCGLKS